jgi:copper chaperone NosL
MRDILHGLTRELAQPLAMRSRLLVLVAALLLPLSFLSPLWRMDFVAQQYPEGLELFIYSHALVGGDGGNDLTEINVLNHYIGMRELEPEDFNELKWIPLVIGMIAVLTLRASFIGTLASLLDLLVISAYFGLFSLWSFWYKLYLYGHQLDPRAAVKVEPFTPPVFGHKMVGQFEVWSYPSLGTYLMLGFGVLLLAAMYLTWKKAPVSDSN